MYDIVIIGAGPAGITASLYAKRTNLSILVLYKDESALEKAEKIENYYGFENGITGQELYKNGIKQAKNLGIDVKQEEVVKIDYEKDEYKIITTKEEYKSKALILATGNKKNAPKIKGIKEFEGKGISYCAICDGFFYRNKDVAVLGSGDYAISETNELINIAKEVTILTNEKQAPNVRAENVKINTRKIKEIDGENRVQKVVFEDGTSLIIDGIFVAEGVAGSSEFAKKLGIMTKKDKIVVNGNMETNIKGLYACGDCTGELLQISKSIYEGTIAGLQSAKYVKNLKGEE